LRRPKLSNCEVVAPDEEEEARTYALLYLHMKNCLQKINNYKHSNDTEVTSDILNEYKICNETTHASQI
jgi:hypothetical protein